MLSNEKAWKKNDHGTCMEIIILRKSVCVVMHVLQWLSEDTVMTKGMRENEIQSNSEKNLLFAVLNIYILKKPRALKLCFIGQQSNFSGVSLKFWVPREHACFGGYLNTDLIFHIPWSCILFKLVLILSKNDHLSVLGWLNWTSENMETMKT